LNQGDGFGKKDINQAAQAIEQGHHRMLLGFKKGGKKINQAAQAIDQGKKFGGRINQGQTGRNSKHFVPQKRAPSCHGARRMTSTLQSRQEGNFDVGKGRTRIQPREELEKHSIFTV
jgi:hypothetical protein